MVLHLRSLMLNTFKEQGHTFLLYWLRLRPACAHTAGVFSYFSQAVSDGVSSVWWLHCWRFGNIKPRCPFSRTTALIRWDILAFFSSLNQSVSKKGIETKSWGWFWVFFATKSLCCCAAYSSWGKWSALASENVEPNNKTNQTESKNAPDRLYLFYWYEIEAKRLMDGFANLQEMSILLFCF